jgi:hypothetical protein
MEEKKSGGECEGVMTLTGQKKCPPSYVGIYIYIYIYIIPGMWMYY